MRPSYKGYQISQEEYFQWIKWGEEWFRYETFGNERIWTDLLGLFQGTYDIQTGSGDWGKGSFLRTFFESVDLLDGVRGNLFSGNGGAYTQDLVLVFPPNSMIHKSIPIPERVHTGLDVEAGSVWPVGIVPVQAPKEEENLPYLVDPGKFSKGPTGIGPVPFTNKFRVGLACAVCHHSLDVDWDGKPDLQSLRMDDPTEGSKYRPENGWAIGNQDISLGWIFATTQNTVAGFQSSGPVGEATQQDAREWAKWTRQNYKTNPNAVSVEVIRGLITSPRGYADDMPDGLLNPLQFPSLFTHLNWPFNYNGVILRGSDRNNNVWSAALDLSGLVALCSDRGGSLEKITSPKDRGLYSEITAREYAEIFVENSPIVMHDPTQREILIQDILGNSDGVPGLLRNDCLVLVKGVPGVIPQDVLYHPENIKHQRLRDACEFEPDGNNRGPMLGFLGVRVKTPPEVRKQSRVDELEGKYGINGDEFLTDAVSMMLDWVPVPTNNSTLLANARKQGLVEKGYGVFKANGCAGCHSGPIFSNNRIIPLKSIGTDPSLANATKMLQIFVSPPYDPATGVATSGGIVGFFTKLFSRYDYKPGYKVVTLRYLWGSAPYLHDGGVAVALSPESNADREDLQSLLSSADSDKIYGVSQILSIRESNPKTYLRPDAALSLQALLLRSERARVIAANEEAVHPVAGKAEKISMSSMHVHGIGHEFWINDTVGGDKITSLVTFLLALDDNPGR